MLLLYFLSVFLKIFVESWNLNYITVKLVHFVIFSFKKLFLYIHISYRWRIFQFQLAYIFICLSIIFHQILHQPQLLSSNRIFYIFREINFTKSFVKLISLHLFFYFSFPMFVFLLFFRPSIRSLVHIWGWWRWFWRYKSKY